MNPANIDVFLENKALKNEFAVRNLDLSQVFFETPENLEHENRRLTHLLDWVEQYKKLGSREKMENKGYLYPPIDPDFSPDNDWFLFKRWLKGLPLKSMLIDQLPSPYLPVNPEQLSEEELSAELDYLYDLLFEAGFYIDYKEDIPPQLVYENVVDHLDEEFELMTEGFWHLDGCTGYCPGCFQRPWCEAGGEVCWREDEEAGEICFPDCVRKYVSPSPVSLKILRKCQAEFDKSMEEIQKSGKGLEITKIDPAIFDDLDEDRLPL
ncbi:hypothetical protein JW935_28330 [candidate division KSB1 bacterium]|nr:hypothetical protein [candidate division KSB1 bacterium]